jgi:hypothetical protein
VLFRSLKKPESLDLFDSRLTGFDDFFSSTENALSGFVGN